MTNLRFRGSSKVGQPQSVMTTTPGGPAVRPPDLILQPCQEGMDFTMKLLAANRMTRVVEVQCFFDTIAGKENQSNTAAASDANGFTGLSEEDVKNLFLSMSSTTEAFEEHEEGDDDDVLDEFHLTDSKVVGGLPNLQSLTIVCRKATEATPSFIRYLTAFLRSSLNFPNFSRLTIHGVNLRGDVWDLRALTEAFRLHPSIRSVDMKQCFFSSSQHAEMATLQKAFMEKEQHEQRSTLSSSLAPSTGPYYERQLVFGSTNQAVVTDNNKGKTSQASTWESSSVSKEVPLLGEKTTREPWWSAWIDCCLNPLAFCCRFDGSSSKISR